MASGRLNLPNVVTLGRILACPGVLILAMYPAVLPRLAAFVVFLAAAFSDIWDGYLARRYGLVTDLGKLLDPLADKLLLVATFVPFYILSHGDPALGHIPWWGPLPIWVMVVIFGREVGVTLFRIWAARRGVVISAGKSGKRKALIQNFFIGGLLLWYPLKMLALSQGWSDGFWGFWSVFHGAWIGINLTLALILTVYSFGDYLWSYRALVGVGR
ncbi:CDP-diacylglycerol--glycerol-3-phosphate 3-phosphatidyltransferase [Gemmatimonadota bacterium]